MHLTKRKIKSLEYDPQGPNQQIVWDDNLDNFGVRLYESGTKSFVIRYRNEHNRRRYVTIGKFSVLTLQQARKRAREKFVEVQRGGDPAAKKKRVGAENMEELAELYIEKHAKPHKKTWERDAKRLERHILPQWRNRTPQSITHSDVADLHRDIGIGEGHKYEANRTVALIQKVFNFAAQEGIIDRTEPNPAKGVQKFKEESRDRWVTPEEMPQLAEALGEEDNPYIRWIFWMLLLTGCRKSEMLNVKWDDVDLGRGDLYIRETKTNESRTVPLSDAALEILDNLPREANNPYVFCGRKPGQPLNNINDAWIRIRKKADLEDVRIHDLRRTTAAYLAQSGYSMLVIKHLLGHSVKDITGVYARMSPRAVRKAVNELGQQLQAAAEGGGDEKVIPIASARGRS